MSATRPAVNATGELVQLTLLAACFVLSGFAALVYQTAWARQFALVFGTSELAVATVLAAYMAGLALGAWIIERWLPRVARPVRVYAILELGIAASALLLVPALLHASQFLLASWFGGQSAPPSSEQVGTSLYYLASAFVALVVPTTLMGATLPLLARHAVHTREQIGLRIGLLYASNTLGAVGGALATAFLLLPNLGLSRSIWVAAALNALVFVLAAALVQRGGTVAPVPDTPRVRFAWSPPPAAVWVLPVMLLSGAVSFTQEVLWARMLSQVVGSSIYAFGVMLGSFLAGIALGGAAGAWLARDRERSILGLYIAQLGTALAAAAAFLLLDRVVPEQAGLMRNVFLGLLLLLPMTFFIGTTYPFAVRVLADRPEEAAAASARVYAWNTVGGIVGAIAAGFFVIPALRYEGTMRLAVAVSVALALLCVLLLRRPRPVLAGLSAALAIAAPVAFAPRVPERLLLSSPLNAGAYGQILYYDVGRSASVVVLQQDGGLALRTNGLPEALMDSPGTAPRFSGEFWMSSLSVLARPSIRDTLVVGFGGGVVVEGVPASVRRIDVIELEPKVIEANRATRARRKFDPLSDPRVRLITNDARGSLSLTDKRYDAIVSQPSHPWTAGASHLYTREFMRLARRHLAEDGVFVQWMNVAFLDEGLLRSLTATLIDVFGSARIYRPDPNTLVFLASSRPLAVEQRLVREARRPLSETPAHYARFGINSVEDVLAALAVDEEGAAALAAGAPLITDDSNRMATSSVFELGRGLNADATGRVLAPYDPLQRGAPWVFGDLRGSLDFAYVARRIMFFRQLDPSAVDRARRMARHLGAEPAGRYAQVLLLAAEGRTDAAARLARESLAAFPDDVCLRYTAIQPALGAIARGEGTPELLQIAAGLPASARATLQGSQFLVQGKFGELAGLDRALAETAWTDPWFPEALQLRAEWRSRVANPDLTRRLADEAIGMVDRMVVVQPTLPLFATRARAALNADRPEVLVESVSSVARFTVAQAGRDAPGRQRARQQLAELVKLLDGREKSGRADAARVAEVRRYIEDSIKGLS
jgi:spermidine synthase